MSYSQSFLNEVPVEILRSITAPLARKELKALRLTNRKLHSVASETLFESIAITTNGASYAQLLNIAASDFWSAQVRHLDWVLLRAIKGKEGLAQELLFDKPWTSTLHSWGIIETGEQPKYYYGLDLQCQLVKRFPNIRTVSFWNADDNQRKGCEPWETPPSETYVDCSIAKSYKIIESTKMFYITEDWEIDRDVLYYFPPPNDVFSVLRKSNLTPRLIKTVKTKIQLDYSESRKLESVQMRKDFSVEPYRGAIDYHKDKEDLFSYDTSWFESLVRSDISELRTLRINNISIFIDNIDSLLEGSSSKLLNLDLDYVELVGDGDLVPTVSLLEVFKLHYDQGQFHDLKVTFRDLTCRGFRGLFSATEHQVRDWLEGRDDELLKTASSAFVEGLDDSDSDEDGDDNMRSEQEEYEAMVIENLMWEAAFYGSQSEPEDAVDEDEGRGYSDLE